MTFAGTAGLGAVAGLTIFLGLPVARLGRLRSPVMALLNAGSIGVLLFLLYDIVGHADETVSAALDRDHARGAGYGLVLAAGLTAGLLGLVLFERAAVRRQKRPQQSTGGPGALAVGAAAAHPAATAGATPRRSLAPAERIALFIAIGIGLHNFSEGLVIGQSSESGAYKLLGVLVIGFGLHNITEGFGVTGPLLGQRPSWGFLALLGAIGGGPTILGTLIGYQATNDAVSVLFLGLAAGAIIYVVGELQHVARRIGSHDLAMVGLLAGFLAGYATDKLLFVAGG